MDKFTPSERSSIMRKIRSKDTKIEQEVRSALWKLGIRFRKNTSLPGKPDISHKRNKIVVFIDSCFWHGCEKHCRMPKSNKSYWEAKINKNRIRDRMLTKMYNEKGWKIIRIWEHELKEDFGASVGKIVEAMSS